MITFSSPGAWKPLVSYLKGIVMNAAQGLMAPLTNLPKRYVRVRAGVKGFVEGNRYVTPNDDPFPVDDNRAGDLLKAGLVEICDSMAGPAIRREVDRAPERAERTVAPQQRRGA